jgi:hypothetical protein
MRSPPRTQPPGVSVPDTDAAAPRPGRPREASVDQRLQAAVLALSLLVGAYLGELVRHGEVAPEWMDRALELLWVLMAPG